MNVLTIMNALNRNVDLGVLILRLSIGVLLLLHGISKAMHGIDPIVGMITEAGLPAFFAYGVYIGEIVAPLLIILGVATRPAALIIVINMLVAIFTAHSSQIFTMSPMGGWTIELPALYLFGALALVFTGAGKYSLSRKSIWN